MIPVDDRYARWVVFLAPTVEVTPEPIIRAHCAHLEQLEDEGVLELAGPFLDGRGGMLVLRVADEAAARALAERDPFVIEGVRSVDLAPLAVSCRENGHLGMGQAPLSS